MLHLLALHRIYERPSYCCVYRLAVTTAFVVHGLHQQQLFIRMIIHEYHHLSTDGIISSAKRQLTLLFVI